jgi:TonB family protein
MVSSSLARLRRGETVFIGETAGSHFFLPSEALGSKEHALLVPHGDGWGLDLGIEGIKGDLLVDGKVVSLDDARLTGLLKGGVLPMQPGSKARLRFGQFSMLLSYVNEPRTGRAGLVTGGGIQEFAYMALSAIVHFSVLILFVYLQPEDEIQIRRPKSQMVARMIAVESIKNKEKEKKKEEKEEEELPEKVELKDDEVALDDADPTPTVTESEKLTPTEKPKVADVRPNPRTGPRIPMTEEQKKIKNEQTCRIAKATAEKYIPTDMLASVTGKNLLSGPKGSGLNMKVIAGGAGAVDDGGGAAGAMGSYAGGGTEGQGGYAAMDFGGNSGVAGTGGTGVGGPGGPVVAGLDKDGGGGNRLKAGGLQERELKAIVASAGEATTSGGLTKKIIQQYMDRQKGQIVSCYKKEVQKNPNLEGKVVVAFTISPTGKVMSPSIRSSTLGNGAVESCIVSKLGLFKFPAPDNAGAVKVTYPFLFRTR